MILVSHILVSRILISKILVSRILVSQILVSRIEDVEVAHAARRAARATGLIY